MLKIFQYIKNSLLIFPFILIFSPLKKAFLFFSFLLEMVSWIQKNKNTLLIKGELKLVRNYDLRFKLYEAIKDHFALQQAPICYLEFGVASGSSFRWWLEHNTHEESWFNGFDTFEGLPEDWGGFYKKGDMMFSLPDIPDSRAKFSKGLFQDTLPAFLTHRKNDILSAPKRVIHLDADLYSSTIFVLSQLYPFLKKGDLILFDEFNVPLHEFRAFKEFCDNFYVTLKPIAQVNSFYQAAFIVE